MYIERLNNIDELLGSKESRYFGSGFKKVNYTLKGIYFDIQNYSINSQVCIDYPTNWSIKNPQVNLERHLSTIDTILLSIWFNTAYISIIYNLNDLMSQNIWVKSISVNMGNTGYSDLENVVMDSRAINSALPTNNLNKYCSTFENKFGGISIKVTYEHYINSLNKICFLNKQEFEKKLFYRCLQLKEICLYNYYRHSNHEITNIEIDKNQMVLSSEIDVKKNNELRPIYFSVIDFFIIVAQQSESLLYYINNINRKDTNNLWLRKLSIEYLSPVMVGKSFRQYTKINKLKTLLLNNSNWQIADFECYTNLSNNPIKILGSTAHQLPKIISPSQDLQTKIA